jgi:hypothetical protein
MQEKMLSLFDYLGRAAGSKLGLEVAKYAREQNSKIEIRQVSNPKYSGPINLYTENLIEAFFNNPNYREIINEDEQQYKEKYKKKVEKNNLPF